MVILIHLWTNYVVYEIKMLVYEMKYYWNELFMHLLELSAF